MKVDSGLGGAGKGEWVERPGERNLISRLSDLGPVGPWREGEAPRDETTSKSSSTRLRRARLKKSLRASIAATSSDLRLRSAVRGVRGVRGTRKV